MQYQNVHRRRPVHFETIEPGPASSIRAMRTRSAGFTFNPHYHPELELTLIVKGHGLRFVGETIDDFAAGDLVLLGGGLLHTYQSHAGSDANEAIVLQFRREVLAPVETNWPEARSLSRFLNQSVGGLRLQDDAGAVRAGMESLLATEVGSLERMAEFLRVLKLAASARRDTIALAPAGEEGNEAAEQLNRVLQHVHARLSEPLLLAEVAEVAGLSPTSFSRFFSRRVGKTFTRYVNEWRIRIACRKLIETKLPITDIAFACGFENLSNFNRRFQQFRQTTPRAYRADHVG